MLKKFLFLVNLTLLAVCLYIGMHVKKTFVESKAEDIVIRNISPSISKGKTPAVKFRVKEPQDYYHIILERNLFLSPKVIKKEEDTVSKKRLDMGDSLLKTPLQLQLKGTVVDMEPSYSWVVIEDEITRKQDLYKIGEMVRGAQIIEIYRNRVILRREGKEEILMVAGEDTIAKLSGRQTAQILSSQQSYSSVKPPEDTSVYNSGLIPKKIGETRWGISGNDPK